MKDWKKVAADTGFFVAVVRKSDNHHEQCCALLKKMPLSGQLFTVESCLSEAFFLLPSLQERQRLISLLKLLKVNVMCLSEDDLQRSYDLLMLYHDQRIDFADACLIALCEKLRIATIATIDRKDFTIYRPRHTRAFHIVP